jgi:Bacterial PH domain
MGVVSTVRFRRSPATTLAAVVFMIAGLSVARWAPYLLILLVIPAVVAVWAWRSGTDADQDGLTVRALLGRRRIPWSDVAGLVTDDRGQVSAQLTSGRVVPLPAVGRQDVTKVVEAAGEEISPR